MINGDVNIRSWCIDYSVRMPKCNRDVEDIISDAERIYGFITRTKADVLPIDKKEKEK